MSTPPAPDPGYPTVPLAFERLDLEESRRRVRAFRDALRRRRTVRDFSTDPVAGRPDRRRDRGRRDRALGREPPALALRGGAGPRGEAPHPRGGGEGRARVLRARAPPPSGWPTLRPSAPTGASRSWRTPPSSSWCSGWTTSRSAGRTAGEHHHKNYYVPESVGIAVGMLLVALHTAGLATLTHTPSPMGFLGEVLGRPRHERAYVLLPVGYPAAGRPRARHPQEAARRDPGGGLSTEAPPPLAEEAKARFRAAFGRPPEAVATAPGRVNLIGDHTDYNDGFVLPMAIDRGTVCAVGRARGRRPARPLGRPWGNPRRTPRRAAAARRVELLRLRGRVAWALREAGHERRGADVLVLGNLPIGAGLSSSASLELAAARALMASAGLPWEPVAMARLAQRAENLYVGVSCGLMDHFAAAASAEGSALLLDCRSLEVRAVPRARSRRGGGHGHGCPSRPGRERLQRATGFLRGRGARARGPAPGPPGPARRRRAAPRSGSGTARRTTWKRAAHVVAENQRPVAMAAALGRDDLGAAGRLMNESHASLRDLYEVSSPELDLITDLAREHPACLGARLTGAGFGGCAVALVRSAGSAGFRLHSGRGVAPSSPGAGGDLRRPALRRAPAWA